MPVAGLGKFLFHHVADQKDLASAKKIADDKSSKCRDKYHGNTTDDAGNRQRKSDLEKNLQFVGTKVPGSIDHIHIDLGKRIVNG